MLLGNGWESLNGQQIRRNDGAGFYLLWDDHLPRRSADDLPDTPSVTPGGTSTGSNAIWYDLDPEAGTLTITYDDVAPFSGDRSQRNAYQLQFTDLSDQPGASEGDFSVEYRYEAVEWAEPRQGAAGFSLGDGLNAFNILGPNDEAGCRALPEQGPILFTFDSDSDSVASNLPGLEELPLFGPPIRGTASRDLLVGSDEPEVFRPDRGRDTLKPGLGEDIIDIGPGANTVRGSMDELLNDTLRGGFDNDRLPFQGEAIAPEAISFDRGRDAILLDLDGDGTPDDGIAVEGVYDRVSVLTPPLRHLCRADP
ncbi:hypothetical protein [Jannaschia seohaensis]|uniref:Hemolysin-type calcium-binding repeat-containing protein n=1 Tax=Jannaschia seohaensis TaxID=475081 RepID=A0A2Y9BXW7_9RHOB|nr:hypothetical protein [Jannaschia seohaensis]PWJ21162.1 hypothetical protein BCF38_102412 [Jannaschia seohaensis]SSA41572.1 hypothetical protein SAMN05421539_102412 [Jannaschia seohaensis]